jgi:ribosomal protein S18 acetylase RimI-like enzyme
VEVRIRACEAGDARALSLVAKATFLESYVGALAAADILDHCTHEHAEARYADWLGNPGYRLWIAEAVEGAGPVGYAVLSPPDLPVPTDAFDAELKRIYLLHRLQGSGVGARLLAAASEAARAQGARRLLLGVWRGNDKAIGFYRRQGFTVAGERKFQVGANVYDDLVLARAIEAARSAEDRGEQGQRQREGERQA